MKNTIGIKTTYLDGKDVSLDSFNKIIISRGWMTILSDSGTFESKIKDISKIEFIIKENGE